MFYADPFVDMHNRMKEALVLLGKLPRAVVRPPLVKLERAEIVRIRQALIEAGLLDKKRARRGLRRADRLPRILSRQLTRTITWTVIVLPSARKAIMLHVLRGPRP